MIAEYSFPDMLGSRFRFVSDVTCGGCIGLQDDVQLILTIVRSFGDTASDQDRALRNSVVLLNSRGGVGPVGCDMFRCSLAPSAELRSSQGAVWGPCSKPQSLAHGVVSMLPLAMQAINACQGWCHESRVHTPADWAVGLIRRAFRGV
jgi:hypothetical protein